MHDRLVKVLVELVSFVEPQVDGSHKVVVEWLCRVEVDPSLVQVRSDSNQARQVLVDDVL